MAEIEKVKCLIIGSGPAGYTAAGTKTFSK